MASAYTVEQLVDRVIPDGKGGFEDVLLVVYTIPEGYRGSISIAKKGMTPEKVKDAIEKDVAKIKAIYAL
jgi:hypothetical protein